MTRNVEAEEQKTTTGRKEGWTGKHGGGMRSHNDVFGCHGNLILKVPQKSSGRKVTQLD